MAKRLSHKETVTNTGVTSITNTTPFAIARGKTVSIISSITQVSPLTAATISLQKSNDWDPVSETGTWVSSTASITGTSTVEITDTDPGYEWARLSFNLTGGEFNAVTDIRVKKDV